MRIHQPLRLNPLDFQRGVQSEDQGAARQRTPSSKIAHVPAGLPYTLQVVKTVVRSTDAQERALTTDFNTYEHLEAAFIKAKRALENIPPEHQPAKPLRLVVIDTAVALTTWERQAGSNSDEGVKGSSCRSCAQLQNARRDDCPYRSLEQGMRSDSPLLGSARQHVPLLGTCFESFMDAKHLVDDGRHLVGLAEQHED